MALSGGQKARVTLARALYRYFHSVLWIQIRIRNFLKILIRIRKKSHSGSTTPFPLIKQLLSPSQNYWESDQWDVVVKHLIGQQMGERVVSKAMICRYIDEGVVGKGCWDFPDYRATGRRFCNNLVVDNRVSTEVRFWLPTEHEIFWKTHGILRNFAEFRGIFCSKIYRNSAEFRGIPYVFAYGIPHVSTGLAAIFSEQFQSFVIALKNHIFYWFFRSKLSKLSAEP